jgi:DNA-binding NtrC family response regulator
MLSSGIQKSARRLPLADEIHVLDPLLKREGMTRNESAVDHMNERILVVDDEEGVRLALKYKLKLAGFCVDVAVDGEEALEKLNTKPTDVVLLDIAMPRMNGIEALTIIRQKYPQTEIVMLTGMQDVKTAVECMAKGAFYYVAKPYYFDDLLGLIGRALERKRLVTQNEALKSELARCVVSANSKSENEKSISLGRQAL